MYFYKTKVVIVFSGFKLNGRRTAHVGDVIQVFIAGKHIGGATDTFEAVKSGELQSLLKKSGIQAGYLGDMDPYELLPSWLHKR